MPDRCPITYETLPSGEKYSKQGLKRLSPKLESLEDLIWTTEELRIEARKRSDKLSIQGVQLKLSARLNISEKCFELVDQGGRYVLKPENELYPELAENEDLSMRLAATVGIEVPLHGLLYAKDVSFVYFIQRFDRIGRNQKLAVEDFAQLTGGTRETKYRSSMEKVAKAVETYGTFPALEKEKLWERTIFNYLIGNEDMHLKNFSLISRDDKVELAPAYDFLNSTIALERAQEELALPLNGKKRNLKKGDFIDYFAFEKLGLKPVTVEETLERFSSQIPTWKNLIAISFLSSQKKREYSDLLDRRKETLGL